MKALTPNQERLLTKLKANGIDIQEVGIKFKNNWNKTWSYDGYDLRTLKALQRKGYISIMEDRHTETGVYNPQAKSWGYSRSRIVYSVAIC